MTFSMCMGNRYKAATKHLENVSLLAGNGYHATKQNVFCIHAT